ncbi:RecQ family ATP-dependent DNA helicase [Candidatus Tokpelaia sp.]|uniref:RecQ family ATP-dependent DNA helicase n=1 Tax=Candidatus Tokpelaia sp. TaxID=2233777 RepID=UPI00123A0438|nr:RecQ family ATP-dependent DNA helicase [Candidatus Tokpelaia sp.]KAA6406293.1 DNA helicase [Candidatus Tokpelaia sp.]
MRRKRLSKAEWQKIRPIVLARDKYRCVECKADIGAAGAAHIHHVVPLASGGNNAAANLVSLCILCHAAHHPNQGMSWNLRCFFKAQCYNLARLCDREGLLPEQGNFDSFLRVFGKEKFRAGQLPLILAALKKQSFLFVSPTGSGKSLCFQLPALMQPYFSVVICPLKALMAEQVSELWRQKIAASFINSDLPRATRREFYRDLRDNAVKLAYMTPERFFTANEAEQQALARLRPAFLIIDEAHCVDRWGTAFRPEYARLAEVRALLGNPPVLAFTATAGKEMQSRIMRSLGCDKARYFVRDVDRPNIALFRIKAAAAERSAEILRLLRLPAIGGKKLMIFVPTVKIGQMLREDLKKDGVDVPFYHARAENSAFERQEIVKRFKGESKPEINWLICTKAFGMGLDIANVRMVIHWQQSASVEDYLQEYGRAGRDGRQAVAIVFYGGEAGTRIQAHHDDIKLLEFMADRTVENAVRERGRKIMEKNKEITEWEAAELDDDKENIRQTEYENIAALHGMITANACFRRALSACFEQAYGEQDTARAAVKPKFWLSRLALWIVAKLYVAEPPVFKRRFCCDYCEKVKIRAQTGLIDFSINTVDSIEKLLHDE